MHYFLPTAISRWDHKNLFDDVVSYSLHTAENQLLSACSVDPDLGPSSQSVAEWHAWLPQPGEVRLYCMASSRASLIQWWFLDAALRLHSTMADPASLLTRMNEMTFSDADHVCLLYDAAMPRLRLLEYRTTT